MAKQYTDEEMERAALALGWVKAEGGWNHPIHDQPDDPPFADAKSVCAFERAYMGTDGKWTRGCRPWAHVKGCKCVGANRMRVKGMHVDHIDGDLRNNDPANLRLVTAPKSFGTKR